MYHKSRFNRLSEISRALLSRNEHEKCFHFTYAFWGSKLLAIGMNKPKTHTKNLSLPYLDRQSKENISDQIGIHSEVDCILKLGRFHDYQKINFFNFRIDKNDKIAISRPCNGCLHLFEQIGFKNIFFTNNKGELEKI